jgi:flagellar hook-associated protein 3 FlgL
MAINNVSTYGSLQSLLQNMSQAQNALNNDQIAISSNHVSQTFDGLTGSIEQLTSFNAQIARLTNYQQDNSVDLSEQQASNNALGQIQQIATNVVSLIAGQTGGIQNTGAAFQQQLQDELSSLTAQLNTTFGGNYIFSGTATGTAPVKSPVPDPITVGVPDNSYYQGSDQDSTTRIGDNQTITNSIRADNTAFQQIFAGIAQASQPGAGTADLQNAENLVNTGLQGVIALQATVNSNIVNLQQVDTQNQTLQNYYSGLTTTLTQSNVVSLSTQVAQDQSVLEASFETFSRISSLSLANFLK